MSRSRVLDPEPCRSLEAYRASGGCAPIEAARAVQPEAVVATVEAAGLRGRGGAGFPTATKWRTVVANRSDRAPLVVVNGAEGEPGSFKDRALLRANPYKILEGALIAAHAVGADRVTVALKASFQRERDLLESAIAELVQAGVAADVHLSVSTGPSEYLFGEESALLEVLADRPPFPRVSPPYRHGADDPGSGTGTNADVALAAGGLTTGSPTLVNNVETLANVPAVVFGGPDAFRSVGTPESPGTILVTTSGRCRVHAVAEVALGTPLRQVIEEIGGGPIGRRVVGILPGVSAPIIPGDQLDVPLAHESLEAIGSALGCGALLVIDDEVDPVAVAHGVSRFLGVESCGQCIPCKRDGLEIADALDRLLGGSARERAQAVEQTSSRLFTVADEARCALARQHESVVGSLLSLFPASFRARAEGVDHDGPPLPIAPIIDIVDGVTVLDEAQASKQPDWSYEPTWSGSYPSESLDTALPSHRS